jgi:hypothetical protein
MHVTAEQASTINSFSLNFCFRSKDDKNNTAVALPELTGQLVWWLVLQDPAGGNKKK